MVSAFNSVLLNISILETLFDMTKTQESDYRANTARLAYFYYLERERLGLPGNEQEDWMRAEAEAAHTKVSHHLPLTAIKGIGPRVAAELELAGVETCADLAKWSLSDFGQRLPRLTARAKNGAWIEQAQDLVGVS